MKLHIAVSAQIIAACMMVFFSRLSCTPAFVSYLVLHEEKISATHVGEYILSSLKLLEIEKFF